MSPVARRMHTWELADAVAAMSEPVALDLNAVGSVDLFVAVLGFEDRALAIPSELAAVDADVSVAAVVRYRTNEADNERNWPEMQKALASLGTADPPLLEAGGQLAHQLRDLVKGLPVTDRLRVVWDISVASNDLVIEGLGALLDCDVDLTLLYAEAEEYRPTRDEFEHERKRFLGDDQMGLDEGVLEVEVSGEFSGEHAQQLGHELILFPGFSRDRVRSTISKVDPEWIVAPELAPLIWMISRPLHDELLWRRDALREIHGLEQDSGTEVHEVSTFDYRETLRTLDEIYGRRGEEANLTISTLGSKMQAVGIALFCCARPDVRVILARPKVYNADAYTRGARALWSLDLGSMAALEDTLRRVGTIEVTAVDQEA